MFCTIIKAIAARSLFAIHAFVAVWRVVDIRDGDSTFWFLACTIGLLAIEGFISICLRSGREMKWFCPAVFIYLCSIVPPLWLMELDLVNARRKISSTSSALPTNITIAHRREKLSQIPGLQITIDLELPAEMWAKLLEQFLLVNLVLGRWLLPKGGLTRGQLSQLLLVYIGMAADIVELFEAFKEDIVNTNLELTCAVLALWSWSLMQFTLVLTATKARKPRFGLDSSVGKDYKAGGESANSCCRPLKRFCAMDTWAIMTTIIFQDGPFLCLRLLLIIKYNVVSYLNVFFTCKNSLVLVLQIYRMSVLSCESRKRKKVKLQNCSLAQMQEETDIEIPITENHKENYCQTTSHDEQPIVEDNPPQWSRYSPVRDENFEIKKPKYSKKKSKPVKKKIKTSTAPEFNSQSCGGFFNDDGRDSIFMSYSQNKNAPWSDVSFTLSSSNKNMIRPQKSAIKPIEESSESDNESLPMLNHSMDKFKTKTRNVNSQENLPLLPV